MSWKQTAWRRETWAGWTEEGEGPPGPALDPEHRTHSSDVTDGPIGGAAPSSLPAHADELSAGAEPEWSIGAVGGMTGTGLDRSSLDHGATGSHDDGSAGTGNRLIRPTTTDGLAERTATWTVADREITHSDVAPLRGRNSLPVNNPEGLRPLLPRRQDIRPRRMFSGWGRSHDEGRVMPPRYPVDVRDVPGGTTRFSPASGDRDLVRPGWHRPGQVRRPPTDFDESAVAETTDDAAEAPSPFYSPGGW